MLFLLFRLGKDRYAIDVRQVVEVLPLIAVKRIPQAPPAVSGALNYRGRTVPLIDLSQLALGRPAEPRLSTRIVMVDYPDGSGQSRLLGLLAEHVTDTMSCAASDFRDSGVSVPDAPYLGPVATDAQGLVQWIQIDQLLPGAVRDLLFQTPVEV
ncbi:MAG: chemotaxis protein CheW [Arenimonas sp.]|jgi:chemotaxis-related protein WspB